MKELLLAVALTALSLNSCVVSQESIVPSKNYETKQIKVEGFDGISTSTSIDVIYTQTSDSQNIEIYAPDNLMDYVKVYVKDGILKVGFRSEDNRGINIRGKHQTEVRVSAPALHAFYASSSGDIILKNGLQTTGKVSMKSSSSGDIEGGDVLCDELEVGASSSGDVTLHKADCQQLHADASSSGDVEIKRLTSKRVKAEVSSSGDVIIVEGTGEYAEFDASSSGDVVAKGLKAVHVNASASSAGDISCYPIESLKAKSSSAGSIGYRGEPKHIDFSPKKGLHKLD